MTVQYTNLDNILERVYKKLPPGTDVNREDAVEWVWEAINKIGAVDGNYFEMYAYILITDYQGSLPGYIQSIVRCSYVTNDTSYWGNFDSLSNQQRFYMEQVRPDEGFYRDRPKYQNEQGLRYKVQDGLVRTTFEKGILELYYKSFPIDEKLEPLVSQDVYTMDAVVWYIVSQQLWRLMVRDMTYAKLHEYADQQWKFYCKGAASRKLIPGIDDAAAMRNRHLRIMPLELWRNPRVGKYLYPTGTLNDLNTFVLCPFQNAQIDLIP